MDHLDHFNDFRDDPRCGHGSPKTQYGSPNVDKSGENAEEINILSIQTKESTSKSATITPKIVGNKPKPAKQASKPKGLMKLGRPFDVSDENFSSNTSFAKPHNLIQDM